MERTVAVQLLPMNRDGKDPPRAGFNWWEAWGEIKIEWFGGRPPFGERPNAK